MQRRLRGGPGLQKVYDALHGKRVIYDDNGILVSTPTKYFSPRSPSTATTLTSLYTGFEMEWANYKAIVMGWFLQLLPLSS